jgi:hypothetical protein
MGTHRTPAGECVDDMCTRSTIRAADGRCVPGTCPAGWKRLPSGACVQETCPKGTERDPKTEACVAPPKTCPEGTFANPQGRCVPSPCPADHGRPSDRLDRCLPFHKDWSRPCPGKQLRDREGKCQDPKPLTCPPGSRRVANRCYYGV